MSDVKRNRLLFLSHFPFNLFFNYKQHPNTTNPKQAKAYFCSYDRHFG